MNYVVDEPELNLGTPPSVWPAYVAAVACVVLCVLLVISVLAMVIDQFAKLVSISHESASRARVVDSDSVDFASVGKEEVSSIQTKSSASVVRNRDAIQDLEWQLQIMEQKSDSLRQELEKKKAWMAAQMAKPKSKTFKVPVVTNIIFRVESGVYSLDDPSERMLTGVVNQYAAQSSEWRLESGVADLDEISTREVYAFATQIHSKLTNLGVSKSNIKFLLNKQKKQHELIGTDVGWRDGGMIIVLQVRHVESSQ